jgi:hypothetical protein
MLGWQYSAASVLAGSHAPLHRRFAPLASSLKVGPPEGCVPVLIGDPGLTQRDLEADSCRQRAKEHLTSPLDLAKTAPSASSASE